MEYNLNPHFRDDWEHEALKNDDLCDVRFIPDIGRTVTLGNMPVSIAGLGKHRRWFAKKLCPVLHDKVPTKSGSQAGQSCRSLRTSMCQIMCMNDTIILEMLYVPQHYLILKL